MADWAEETVEKEGRRIETVEKLGLRMGHRMAQVRGYRRKRCAVYAQQKRRSLVTSYSL